MQDATPPAVSDLPDCPRCAHPMVRLASFDELSPSDASLDGLSGFAWYGWYLVDISVIVFWVVLYWLAGLLGLAAGRLRTRHRQARLNRIRRRLLPRHPDSLVCAKCLRVIQR